MTVLIDPLVVDLLEVTGQGFVPPQPGETFRVGDGEVYQVGHDDDGVISVEWISRGASNGVRLVTTDVDVLQTYLALWGAGTWREQHGLARLTNDELTPATEYALVNEGGLRRGVRRVDGADVAHRIPAPAAEQLAVALSYPLEVVVAAIKHPTGTPIWKKGRTWRR